MSFPSTTNREISLPPFSLTARKDCDSSIGYYRYIFIDNRFIYQNQKYETVTCYWSEDATFIDHIYFFNGDCSTDHYSEDAKPRCFCGANNRYIHCHSQIFEALSKRP